MKPPSLNWVKEYLKDNQKAIQKIVDGSKGEIARTKIEKEDAALRFKEETEEIARRNSKVALDELSQFCVKASDAALDKLANGETVGIKPTRNIVTECEASILRIELAKRHPGLSEIKLNIDPL